MDGILFNLLDWLTVTYPMVGIVLMVLGGLFVLLELFVHATPTEVDDKFMKRYLDGYLGILFRAIKKMAPKFLQKPPGE